MPVIRFSGVSKRYRLGLTRVSLPAMVVSCVQRAWRTPEAGSQADGFLWALDAVSFELLERQSLALIGPNGAGKSTILKLLAKITMPTSGEIEVRGQLAALIELGAGFHPDLTGRENVYLNGAILGLSRKDIAKRFDDIVAFSELERFIDTPIKRYSSGMTVRLGFAVASCIEPDILLVDEVLAVGDAAFRHKCIGRIKALLENGTSLIFVSHDLGLVKAVCERALYLDHGRVQQFGTTAEVIETYNRVLERQRAALLSEPGAFQSADGGVEITRLEVLDGAGNPVQDTFGDQPLEVRLQYWSNRDVGPANALVRIYRSDGLSCCLLRSGADGVAFELARGGGVISVRLDSSRLSGGTYYAIAWLMDAADAAGMARASSGWFEVKNRRPGEDLHSAVFEPERTWSQAAPASAETTSACGEETIEAARDGRCRVG